MPTSPRLTTIVFWDLLEKSEQIAVCHGLSQPDNAEASGDWIVFHDNPSSGSIEQFKAMNDAGIRLISYEQLAARWKVAEALIKEALPSAAFILAAPFVDTDYFTCLDGRESKVKMPQTKARFSSDGRLSTVADWQLGEIEQRFACLKFFGSPSVSLIEPTPSGPAIFHRQDTLGLFTALSVRTHCVFTAFSKSGPFSDPGLARQLYFAFITHRHSCLDARYAWELISEDSITHLRRNLQTDTNVTPAELPAPAFEPIFVLYRIFPGTCPCATEEGANTLATVEKLLLEEPSLNGCEQRWLIHGPIPAKFESDLHALLQKHGQLATRLPLAEDKSKDDWAAARAYAIFDGMSTATSVLPLSWNSQFDNAGWSAFRETLSKNRRASVVLLEDKTSHSALEQSSAPQAAAIRTRALPEVRMNPSTAKDARSGGWFHRVAADLPTISSPTEKNDFATSQTLSSGVENRANCVYFLIPLKARQSSKDWSLVESNLNATLRSIKNSTWGNWHVLIVGHDRPEIEAFPADRLTFITAHHPCPITMQERILDKSMKERMGAAWLRHHRDEAAFNIAFVDADDLIHHNFVESVLEPSAMRYGFLPTYGYILNQAASPPALTLEPTIFRYCGSGFVGYFKKAELPSDGNDQGAYFSSFRHHKLFFRRSLRGGRPPKLVDLPAIVYNINHTESESALQTKGSRAKTLNWDHRHLPSLSSTESIRILSEEFGYRPNKQTQPQQNPTTSPTSSQSPEQGHRRPRRQTLTHKLHTIAKELRPWWPVPIPDAATAIKRLRLDHSALATVFAKSSLAAEPDTFVLYRIIGNDLPPRHQSGQSLANLRFILDHEPELASCEKRFIINRIVDPATERALLDLLRERGIPAIHLPFNPAQYTALPLDLDCLPRPDFFDTPRFQRLSTKEQNRLRVAVRRHHNNYVMHNNGARNVALKDGRARAKWVAPFDGNCFFTTAAWQALRKAVVTNPHLPFHVVPMARVLDNGKLLEPGFEPPATEEPQLLFRRDTSEIFNPDFPYGRRPKVELFWRLGIPGPWDYWTDKPWDQPRRQRSPQAGQFGLAGWVARLFSGSANLESTSKNAPSHRGLARQTAILNLLESIDHSLDKDSNA